MNDSDTKRYLIDTTVYTNRLNDLLYFDSILFPHEEIGQFFRYAIAMPKKSLDNNNPATFFIKHIDKFIKSLLFLPWGWFDEGIEKDLKNYSSELEKNGNSTTYSWEKEELKYLLKMNYYDSKLRSYTNLLNKKGIKAIPRFDVNSFSNKYKSGDYSILSIIYSKLPILDINNLDVEHFINFLNDKETIIKKRRLFSWQNQIEQKIEKQNRKFKSLRSYMVIIILLLLGLIAINLKELYWHYSFF